MSVVSELIMAILVNTSYHRDVGDVHRVLDVCDARKAIHDGVTTVTSAKIYVMTNLYP